MQKVVFTLEDMMWERRIKSINELSEKTKISRPTLSKIKNNDSLQVHLETLATLCEFLNCDVGDLMKFEKEGA